MTQPVQEPTQGRLDQAQEYRTRQLFRRPPPVSSASPGSYLQWRGAKYGGRDFQVLTTLNSYNGGNGTSWYDGQWEWVDDPTSPFEGAALSTDVDGDWFPFALGNLGPQGSGYGVAFWYYGDATGAEINLEFATTSVDEAGNTPGGPWGTSTSVVGPGDIEFFGAPNPGWYNNDNVTPDHGYKFDLSNGAAGWDIGNVINNASTFYLDAIDGTPLTADGVVNTTDWDESSAFDAGGGPDLEWWMRMRVAPGGNAGTLATIGRVWVYRLNAQQNFVG